MPEEEDFLSCPQPWSLSHVIWNFTQLPTKLFASTRLSLSESSSAVTANWSRPCALHRYTSARGDSVSLQNALTGQKCVFEYGTVSCFTFFFFFFSHCSRILQRGASTKAEFRVWHCVTLPDEIETAESYSCPKHISIVKHHNVYIDKFRHFR